MLGHDERKGHHPQKRCICRNGEIVGIWLPPASFRSNTPRTPSSYIRRSLCLSTLNGLVKVSEVLCPRLLPAGRSGLRAIGREPRFVRRRRKKEREAVAGGTNAVLPQGQREEGLSLYQRCAAAIPSSAKGKPPLRPLLFDKVFQ